MENRILGIHHVTAIAGLAKRNLDFYTKVIGLRMVKKTVNFDDPGTYHFYYGNETGSPGTVLTFFPWENIRQGRKGAGMATEIGFVVPEGSFDFWMKRFEKHNVIYNKPSMKFGEQYMAFLDPDGLKLELVIPENTDYRKPWETDDVKGSVATRGFHSITLTLNNVKPTAEILTEVLGYKFQEQSGNRYRYVTDAVESANLIDLVELPGEGRGIGAGGTVHHIAFRVKDEEALMQFHDKISARGLIITHKIDRNYFYSLYFREPGGVLFEIATDNPGFMVDESLATLGTHLKFPSQYEPRRAEIEATLPNLD